MSRPHVRRAQERLAASLLVDTCEIRRPDRPGVMDPTTLIIDDVAPLIWEGACYVNADPGDAAKFVSIEALGRIETKVRVRLPLTCPTLRYGDEITIATSDNPALVGVILDVLDDDDGTYSVSKIVRCRRRERIDR